jgi:membrane protein DedA with SNARE-associated domain
VSRERAPGKQPKPAPAAGTPIWVWLVYALAILAGAIIVFSVLFTLGAALLARDVPVSYDFSLPATILWGGLVLAGVVTFVVRRRQRR